VTGLVLFSALVFSFQQTPIYEATTKVLVQPLPSGPQSTSVLQVVVPDTEAELIASDSISEAVVADLKLDSSPSQLVNNLEVGGLPETQAVPGAQVLEVTYESADAELVHRVANAFATEYIEYRAEQALEMIESARSSLTRRLQRASREVSELSAQIDEARGAGDEALATTLESQRDASLTRVGTLQQRLDEVQPSGAVRSGGAQIIESATMPKSPTSPNPIRNGALGLLMGLALGCGLAFLRERLDDRFRGRADLERVTEAPVLGALPRFTTKGRGPDLVTLTDSSGASAESYRSLRTNLQFLASTRGIRSVLITSPSSGEGKTTVTANLGVALAQAGRRVILVSSDLRRPKLEEFFNLKNARDEGLSSWLSSDDLQLPEIVKDPGIPNLRVVPSGSPPPNPAELLSSPRLAPLISQLMENADLVLFDSPPVLAVADTAILASNVDATILVIDSEATGKSATLHAKAQLERVAGRLVGSALNNFDPSSSGYYYGAYAYYGARGGDDVVTADVGNGQDVSEQPRRLFRQGKQWP
jgi:polysaccharide biosynthesis transport protein